MKNNYNKQGGIFIKGKRLTLTLILILIILSSISIFIGVLDVNIKGVLKGDLEQIEILLISRFPRLLATILTGIGMSVSGLIMQQLCRNKFISPTTGATISSAQLGILMSLLLFPSSTLVGKTAISFITAMTGTCLFVFLVQKIKFKDVVMVPLVGIMFGNIIGGFTDYFTYKHNLTQTMSTWLVGDFSLIIRGKYEIAFIALPFIVLAFIFANYFNIVGMGENFSKNLGINYKAVLLLGLGIVSIITVSIIITVGSVPYIGLIIPNIISMYKGDKLKNNLVDTALFGAIFVLSCDMAGRIINFPYEIPISVTSGVTGTLIFIFIMINRLNPKGAIKNGLRKKAQIQ